MVRLALNLPESPMKSLNKLLAASSLALATAAHAAALKVDVYTGSPAGFQVTSTLIQGEKDAILVDAQFTVADAHRLTAMIVESGKSLKQVFITHAHPDHFFGLEVVLKQFPKAEVIARPEVVAEIKKISPGKMAYWKPLYGNNLASKYVTPKAFKEKALKLDGKDIQLIDLGPGESEAATVVYIPELKAIITGDLAYEGVHLWLAENRPDQWLKNLADVQQGRDIERVIAGHRVVNAKEQKDILAQNDTYIHNFLKVSAASKTPDEALKALTAKYPDFQLPIIADIAFKSTMTAPAKSK